MCIEVNVLKASDGCTSHEPITALFHNIFSLLFTMHPIIWHYTVRAPENKTTQNLKITVLSICTDAASTFMIEPVGFHEKSVHFYQTAQCHVPKNGNLHNHCHDKLKFHKGDMALVTWKAYHDAWHINRTLSSASKWHTTCYIISLLEEALKIR